jgi:hypothetical protein
VSYSKTLACLAVVPGLLLLTPVFAEQAESASSDEPVFQLPASDSASASPETSLDSENSGFAGNPMGSWLSWWPEDLVVAPIPSRSPELGWGLAVAGGYFLDLDKSNPDTPKSTVGIGVKATENKSFAGGLGGKFNLWNDNVRIKAAAAYVDVNYRFYGIGNGAGNEGRAVDLSQRAPLLYLSGTYQIFPSVYLGLGLVASTVDTHVDKDEEVPPGFPDLEVDLNISGLEIPFQYDTRDDELFPRQGWLIDVRGLLHREFFGTDFNSESLSLAVNHYRPMRKRDVLATRAYTRASGGDTPFFLLSSFGGRTDLRGYERGRYRDNMMYAVQAEYRWQPLDRWIFTTFAGVGEVAEDYSSFFSNFLPAAGIGTRFVLSPKHKLNLALDVAVGKHGTEFYFGIGEAF